MFPLVTGFMSYGQQTVRAARYIGQSFMITLSHTNHLHITIQYPYEKSITSQHFHGKKQLLNYSIDFRICIFCGNCVEYCPTNCLSMTEEYKLSTYDHHKLIYNQIALGRLPMSIIGDYTVQIIMNSTKIKISMDKPIDSRMITN
ncbi:unnamed protein product [Victoria cruziana]